MKIVNAENQKQWDSFVTSHEDANFLHSWAWGDFHEARGKKVIRRIALDNDDKIIKYTVDGLHPNAAFHEIMAEKLKNYIIEKKYLD